MGKEVYFLLITPRRFDNMNGLSRISFGFNPTKSVPVEVRYEGLVVVSAIR